MKWGKFKEWLEKEGVTDDMEISWIDVCDFITGGEIKIDGNSFSVSD